MLIRPHFLYFLFSIKSPSAEMNVSARHVDQEKCFYPCVVKGHLGNLLDNIDTHTGVDTTYWI